MASKAVDIIVEKMGPPGKRGAPEPHDSGDNESEEDYSAPEDAMRAFMDAVKGDDVQAALDAYEDVKASC